MALESRAKLPSHRITAALSRSFRVVASVQGHGAVKLRHRRQGETDVNALRESAATLFHVCRQKFLSVKQNSKRPLGGKLSACLAGRAAVCVL